jgi:NAD-dependent SIR2 family protein deacetylase
MRGDYDPIGVVDYCCYISSVDSDANRIRSGLWTLGARGYNVKLLKIHGSMNWLQCSNCQRLFVAFDEKINISNYINVEACRHCIKYGIDAKLQGALVMPTFLKDLSNFQIKLVWQNAGVELMEAQNLVFIGYSLPHADFEFRQLLSRMVHRDAAVHVVLYKSTTPKQKRQYNEECNRYRQFFSGRKLTFEPEGVEAFVNRLTATPAC